jgi:sec-independent protein translocase protein TatA
MELLLVLVIVLIVFGAGKLPQLGEGLGKAIKGFKKTVHEPEPEEITEAQSGVGSGGASAGPPPASFAPPSQSSSASSTPTGSPARQDAGKT